MNAVNAVDTAKPAEAQSPDVRAIRAQLPEAPLGHNVWSPDDWKNLHYTNDAINQTDKRGRHFRGAPSHVKYAARLAEGGHAGRLERYRAGKADFEKALAQLPDRRRADALRDALEVLRLIDHEHAVVHLIKPFLGHGKPSIEKLSIQYLYNEGRDPKDPTFKNVKAAADFLRETDMPPSVERLKRVQGIAMQEGVEGVKRAELGQVRNYAVYGDETETGITRQQLKAIRENPYLDFEDRGYDSGAERHLGYIAYPAPSSVKQEALDRIKDSHPEVFQEVVTVKAGQKKLNARAEKALTRQLVGALAEERYAYFNAERTKLGDLDSGEKVLAYIELVANHYRDMISIHPCVNGNGRSVRMECLYDPLDKEGISRPRLNNPNADILSSPSSWRRQVERSILNTHEGYPDIAVRIAMGLTIEHCPELLFPDRPRDVGLHFRQGGKKAVTSNVLLVPVEGAQYAAYFMTRFGIDPDLCDRFLQAPLAVLEEMREEYKEFAKRSQIFFQNDKSGKVDKAGKQRKPEVELVKLLLADPDFIQHFGEVWAHDTARWNFKISRWYQPQIVWRGLCDTERPMSESQILDIFRKPTDFTVCQKFLTNGTVNRAPDAVNRAARAEFERFNRELVEGTAWKTLQDHCDAGPGYAQSYGVSTSEKWETARSFAMGALALDGTMEGRKKHQDQVKSRVVVGAYRAHKDAELNRMRPLFEEFSSSYPRQAEVTAIGGIDPDAVMVAHVFDAKEKIQKTYARNPEKPGEVWVLNGAYKPEDGNLQAFVQKQGLQEVRKIQL